MIKPIHALVEALERMDIPHYLVDYVPFDDSAVYGLPEGFNATNVIVYGGQGLINYGKKHGWVGVFQNEKLENQDQPAIIENKFGEYYERL